MIGVQPPLVSLPYLLHQCFIYCHKARLYCLPSRVLLIDTSAMTTDSTTISQSPAFQNIFPMLDLKLQRVWNYPSLTQFTIQMWLLSCYFSCLCLCKQSLIKHHCNIRLPEWGHSFQITTKSLLCCSHICGICINYEWVIKNLPSPTLSITDQMG